VKVIMYDKVYVKNS